MRIIDLDVKLLNVASFDSRFGVLFEGCCSQTNECVILVYFEVFEIDQKVVGFINQIDS